MNVILMIPWRDVARYGLIRLEVQQTQILISDLSSTKTSTRKTTRSQTILLYVIIFTRHFVRHHFD